MEKENRGELDRLITVDAVLSLLPISRSTLNRKVQSGDFPSPIRVGAGRLAFRESEVRDWISSRPAAETKSWKKEDAA